MRVILKYCGIFVVYGYAVFFVVHGFISTTTTDSLWVRASGALYAGIWLTIPELVRWSLRSHHRLREQEGALSCGKWRSRGLRWGWGITLALINLGWAILMVPALFGYTVDALTQLGYPI